MHPEDETRSIEPYEIRNPEPAKFEFFRDGKKESGPLPSEIHFWMQAQAHRENSERLQAELDATKVLLSEATRSYKEACLVADRLATTGQRLNRCMANVRSLCERAGLSDAVKLIDDQYPSTNHVPDAGNVPREELAQPDYRTTTSYRR